MSDEAKFLLSVSLPPSEQYSRGHMVVVRGDTFDEFAQNLIQFDDQLALHAGRVAASIEAQFNVAKGLGATAMPQNAQNGPQGGVNPQAGGYTGQAPQGPQNGAQGAYAGRYQDAGYDPSNGSYAPQAQQQSNDGVPTSPPPGVGPAPACSHGTKRFLAKPNKGGKPGYWMAWACPAQRGDQSQHPLEFIDQRR